jgi:AMIN domain-containing protein
MYKFSALIGGRLLLLVLCAPSLLAQMSVRSVQVLGGKDKDAVEVEVESSDRIVPQTRVLTGPDRLVIDFPNATPGSQLRSQSVDRGQVKDLRIGLFESKPPVTRIVLDLKSAQSYQVFPQGRTVIIKVMDGAAGASAALQNDSANSPNPSPRPGLVTANFTTSAEAIHVEVVAKPALEVSFRNGLLAIKANKATLSEVLNAIHQRTGADVSSAPGAEQERVVVDLGPAPAQEVMARLLNGSKFNFLIMSAANNPAQLERVILTPRTEGGAMPLPPMQAMAPLQADNTADPDPPVQQAQGQPGYPPDQERRVDSGPRPQPPEITPGNDDPQP